MLTLSMAVGGRGAASVRRSTIHGGRGTVAHVIGALASLLRIDHRDLPPSNQGLVHLTLGQRRILVAMELDETETTRLTAKEKRCVQLVRSRYS